MPHRLLLCSYLTPPGTQGFAPHYDDIEAFVLQVEGCKRWRVYRPHKSQNQLPRVSSRKIFPLGFHLMCVSHFKSYVGNFGQKGLGKPDIDVLLEPGDLLYFPRGFIHQVDLQIFYWQLKERKVLSGDK